MGITKEEFVRRFVDRMIERVGADFMFYPDPDALGDAPTPIREYAEAVAPTYFDDPHRREEGPEECAKADPLRMSEYRARCLAEAKARVAETALAAALTPDAGTAQAADTKEGV